MNYHQRKCLPSARIYNDDLSPSAYNRGQFEEWSIEDDGYDVIDYSQFNQASVCSEEDWMDCDERSGGSSITIIKQPAIHIVKGTKYVPIVSICFNIGVVVILNLAVTMIFIDLLARQAVVSDSYFVVWGPCGVVLLALFVNTIFIFSQTTILFALLVSFILDTVLVILSVFMIFSNSGCTNPSRCTKKYVYMSLLIAVSLQALSIVFILILAFLIQFKVKRRNRIEE